MAQLRQDCGVSRDGSKASQILKAARGYGLEAKGYQKGLTILPTEPPPYIVFWCFNHFLVVEGFDQRNVYVNDPTCGRRRLSRTEFEDGYTGIVLVMKPGAAFSPGGNKLNVFRSLSARLAGATGALAYCILAGFFLTLIGLVIPVFSQVFGLFRTYYAKLLVKTAPNSVIP
ncbi:cysteine peptidase family C39 domain-containing protein [Coleofasciculus sp. F4-SAH-05]|uniref:cysteine peptidase family C39 domain-containing protein n=1 Tax=Coleofasciculus sp. F4-SAH-05 TaxID=3069525 RepID=UPI0032F58133